MPEVLIVGGGPTGIGAALGEARAGVKTLLIEYYGFLGGAATWCLGMPINLWLSRANGTVMTAQFSGRVRKRRLKRLAAMNTDTKDKEILLLEDRVCQLEMQLSIFQKHLNKKGPLL